MTRFRTFLLVVAALLAAGHPCLAALSLDGVCPMSKCSTPGSMIGSTDCCCAPSDAAVEVQTVSALIAAAPIAAGAPAVAALPDLAAHLTSPATIRIPEAVPLFLKNAALLI